MQNMCERLKLIRDVLNKTQPEMANLVGVSRQMISEYENGHTKPGNDVIAKYSEVSGKSINWIRTGEEEQPPSLAKEPSKAFVYKANAA